MTDHLRALITDFGGVLTNDFWELLRGFARREGLPDAALVDLITKDPVGVELLRGLERGAIKQADFEGEIAARLDVPRERLLQRIAADLRLDDSMLAALARLRSYGVKTAILSNSWGSDEFDPYESFHLEDLVDVVIISDRVRLRKPDPSIYELVVEKLGVPARECVFIDDVESYLEPARRLGMTVLHHTCSADTIVQLRHLFDQRP